MRLWDASFWSGNLGKVALYQLSYSRVLSKRMCILQV